MQKKKVSYYIVVFSLFIFALLTLFMSGSVIFDLFGIREGRGEYVPFIVWTNFVAGWLYLMAVFGFLRSEKWTFWLLATVTGLLFLAAIALVIYVNQGHAFELNTVGAMVFRIVLSSAFALIAYCKLINGSATTCL